MGLDLYPAYLKKGDLSPDAFGSEVDRICQEIHDATRGFGTNEKKLLKAMGSMNLKQRCQVPIRYKELFGKELIAVVKSECGSRDFGTALQLLAVNPCEAECLMIDKAAKGVGTDEFLLTTIICGRTNQEMELLKKTYFNVNNKDIGRKLDSELGGDLEQLVFNVLQADEKEFDTAFHTNDRALDDAVAIYKMGQGKLGTNEAGIFKLLVASPPKYVGMINSAYADKYGYTLLKALEKELGGNVEAAALFMIGMKLKPVETIAGLVDKSCRGIGTNELLLTTVLIRYQKVLAQVKVAHQELFGQSIEDRVKKEVGGDYKSLLLCLLESSS